MMGLYAARSGLAVVTVMAIAAGAPQAAIAQTAEGAVAAPGSQPELLPEAVIIYSRDVHHNVGDPYFPGRAHTVVTGPTNLILGSISNGLAPLTDSEIGTVSASMETPVLPMQEALGTGLDVLTQPSGTSTPATGQAGNIVSSTIGGAMSSLSSALGTVSSVLGARP